jgi:hypothetical protein
MTESEWLACVDPTPMLEFLRADRTTSERKLRLFAAACCRRVWDWLGERSRCAIEILERYLDGETKAGELNTAVKGAEADWLEEFGTHHPSNAACAALTFAGVTPHAVASSSASEIADAVRVEASIRTGISLQGWPPPRVRDPIIEQLCAEAGRNATASELSAQCHLLREIFHGPRRAVVFRNSWRTGTVLNLASIVNKEGSLEKLPILADALEDAGCTDRSVLDHCRAEGFHTKGCWVVDLVLKKT